MSGERPDLKRADGFRVAKIRKRLNESADDGALL